ncbi:MULTISPECIES: ESX secretion-associated protein EspG [Actinoalloteichus]|uniref:EspG family n=1 Tax=Actinoalloteichus fjordicus TaxID=1612552 RepID=A0AAC9LG04_9PSEU|nr:MULTISPECIES: ESX secretion-associated protein EspG [Actinoalloteichus]APU17011.1 EspG family [Actinoalloteichus fjordicus]APU23091.1 EspG family [Actinoalloteichus sp. GBA129-24]
MSTTSCPPTTITLSTTEFDVCWDLLGLGEAPVGLNLGVSPGVTWEERRRLIDQTHIELIRRQLADTISLVTELTEALILLRRHDWTIVGHTATATGRLRHTLGAVGRAMGVIADRDGDQITLRRLADYRVVPETVGAIGEVQAGTGESVSVRAEDLLAAGRAAKGNPQVLAEVLIESGVRADEARALAGMSDTPRQQGQFTVLAADRDGTPRHASRSLSFHDTAKGRYLQVGKGRPGDRWITVTPADNTKIIGALHELIDETRG